MFRRRGIRSEVEIHEGGGEAGTAEEEKEEGEEEGRWGRMLPELLGEIVRRVEAGGERWPQRRDFVACAGACRRWREAARAIARPPCETGSITFPSSIKEVFSLFS
ncbi:hypothetical protein BHE74_00006609 [Ensete ventricosum]|nr:hypothetical protein BHE74_00006609 [Ensete ventricosum]